MSNFTDICRKPLHKIDFLSNSRNTNTKKLIEERFIFISVFFSSDCLPDQDGWCTWIDLTLLQYRIVQQLLDTIHFAKIALHISCKVEVKSGTNSSIAIKRVKVVNTV